MTVILPLKMGLIGRLNISVTQKVLILFPFQGQKEIEPPSSINQDHKTPETIDNLHSCLFLETQKHALCFL